MIIDDNWLKRLRVEMEELPPMPKHLVAEPETLRHFIRALIRNASPSLSSISLPIHGIPFQKDGWPPRPPGIIDLIGTDGQIMMRMELHPVTSNQDGDEP